jgi:hypothetical protein
MEISDARDRQADRDRDHLQGDRGSARMRSYSRQACPPRRVAGSRRARRSRQVFAEIETRPLIYMSRGSLTIVHQD